MEVLLIDDASTDGTADVVAKYPFVKLLRNETNRGVSYARNRGVEEAKGKYLHFLDVDDEVSSNFYEEMVRYAEEAGAEVTLMGPADFSAARFSEFGAVAFGCPAMGAEVLEEMEFEPMFSANKGNLGGKKVALFGSFGWGDGEWMRNWEKDCDDAGINLVCDSITCQEAPDDDTLEACRAMGKQLAG